MRSEKLRGIILKRTNFGEADKILTILTLSKGKIQVVAKGIRRIKSRRAPHLELFNEVEIMSHHGRTFDTISEANVLSDHQDLKHELKLSGYLFYLSEILDRILPEDQPHPDVYNLLKATMASLRASGQNEDKIKYFVVQLLWSLGYLPKGEYPKPGITAFVETIIEKPIRSRKFLEEI